MKNTEKKAHFLKLFGKKMKIARKNRNLSQDELARCLQLDRSLISKWETGQNEPKAFALLRLEEILGQFWGCSHKAFGNTEGD